MATGDIVIDILAHDKASRVFAKVGRQAGQTGSSLGKLGKVAVGAAAAGLTAAGLAAYKFTKDAAALDKKQREVVTLFGETGKAAEKSLGQVQRQTRRLSNEFGVAQEVLTGGLYQAISAGVPRQNAFEFMRVASKAAIAGVTDTETAVDGLTSIINAFGMKASDAGKVADSMFQTVKDGKTNFTQLSAAIYLVAPAAAAAGVSMEEANAAIATLTAAGVPTKQAASQIRAALVGLQKPSEAMNKVFGKLGYENAQAAVEAKGLGFALSAVKAASKGNNGELQKLLGSVEAVSAANIIAGTGADKFAASMKNQKDAAGATQAAFKVMGDSVSFQWDRLKTRATNFGLQIGQWLLPKLNDLFKWMNSKGIPALKQFYSVMKDKVGTAIATVKGWLERLRPEAEGMADTWRGKLRNAIDAVKQAFEDAKPTIDTIKEVLKRLGPVIETVVWPALKKIAEMQFDRTVRGIKIAGKAIKAFGVLVRVMWNSYTAPVLRLMLSSFSGIIRKIGELLSTMGRIKGAPKWMQETGDKLQRAADKADALRRGITNIPPSKRVDVNVHYNYYQHGQVPTGGGGQHSWERGASGGDATGSPSGRSATGSPSGRSATSPSGRMSTTGGTGLTAADIRAALEGMSITIVDGDAGRRAIMSAPGVI